MRGASNVSTAPSAWTRTSVHLFPVACPPFIKTACGPIDNNCRPCAIISRGDLASVRFNKRAASGRLGVSRQACGNSWLISASIAASCKSASPDFETITGSITTGPENCANSSATAAMIAGENSMPSLIASISISDKTVEIWAATISGGISCTAETATVFCAVTAVITLAP